MSYWQMRQARGAFDFQGEHQWGVPGIICPACGIWGGNGGALPSVSVDGHPFERQLRGGPLPLPEWLQMRDAVQPLLPPSERVSPGLVLGPLVGHVLNPFRIAWHVGGELVVAEVVRDELARLAPQVKAVETRRESRYGDRYYELEILSSGRVLTIVREGKVPCSTCGKNPLAYPDDELKICDVPDLPLFRLANFKTIIIVREDLVPFFQRECGVAVTFRRAELVA